MLWYTYIWCVAICCSSVCFQNLTAASLVCLLVFKAVYGTAPDYLNELCWSNAQDTARSRLLSAAQGDRFHVRRPTLVIMHLQLTVIWHSAEFQEPLFFLTSFDGPFSSFFFIHLKCRFPWIGLRVTASKKLALYCCHFLAHQHKATGVKIIIIISLTWHYLLGCYVTCIKLAVGYFCISLCADVVSSWIWLIRISLHIFVYNNYHRIWCYGIDISKSTSFFSFAYLLQIFCIGKWQKSWFSSIAKL